LRWRPCNTCDLDNQGFGSSVVELDHLIAALSRLGLPPSIVQNDRDAASALRRGVYGTRAMSALIALEPDAVRATKDLAIAENELSTLRRLTAPSTGDTARMRELERSEAASHATIAAVHARYGYAEAVAREQAYTSDPDVAQPTRRLAEVDGMLRGFEGGGDPSCETPIDVSHHDAVASWIDRCGRLVSERRATDPQRIAELLAEQYALTTRLAALRERHDVDWPM
jgi:hypothetical protein